MSAKTATKPTIPEIASKIRNGFPLSPIEVAAFTGTHPESVRRAIRQGRLPASRIGGARDIRILPTGIAAWLRVPVAELVPSSTEKPTPPCEDAGQFAMNEFARDFEMRLRKMLHEREMRIFREHAEQNPLPSPDTQSRKRSFRFSKVLDYDPGLAAAGPPDDSRSPTGPASVPA